MTSDTSLIGNYVVTTEAFTPQGVATGQTSTFNVEYVDPCSIATLTFNPGFISQQPIEYGVNDPADVEIFSDTMISSSVPAGLDCGDIILTVTDRDGTPIDPAVWSWDPLTQAFTTETSDAAYYLGEGITHPFRIEARYESF